MKNLLFKQRYVIYNNYNIFKLGKSLAELNQNANEF